MMEVEKISNNIVSNNYNNDDDDEDDDVGLPGFRFHPTDEELVGFYLRRKVEKKLIGLEIIKQIDIYKYDPWDLPKNNNGEKEWYYYCKRGRKYKNSARPNRVTAGSGFWKATGIDKPIYSSNNIINDKKCIIGLKKSLVYYKGSAGKGTKTDWQMHEFRLPPHNHNSSEPETWTLCRILKRNVSHRKSILDWKVATKKQRNDPVVNMDALSSKKCSNNNIDSSSNNNNSQIYISFSNTPVKQNTYTTIPPENKHQFVGQQSSGTSTQSSTAAAASNSSTPMDFNEWLEHGNWDELKSIFELPFDPLY